MMAGVEPQADAMHHAAQAGYPTATDLADYLVRHGTPFRTAHDIVGQTVRAASERGCGLEDLPLDVLKSFSPAIERGRSTKSSSSKAPSAPATISAAPLPLRLRSRSNAGRRSSPERAAKAAEPESKDAQGLTGFSPGPSPKEEPEVSGSSVLSASQDAIPGTHAPTVPVFLNHSHSK